MQYFRRFPRLIRWCLAASLVLAPLLPVAQAAVPTGPLTASAESHALHQAHVAADESGRSAACCAQPDSCAAQCCASCAHCTGFMTTSTTGFSVPQPRLHPRSSRLFSFSLISPRERPPRS